MTVLLLKHPLISRRKVNNMRKLLSLLLCLFLLNAVIIPVIADESSQVIWYQESQFSEGITFIDELIETSQARSSSKTYTRNRTITKDGTTIGVIAIRGTFTYDGSTVSVTSKSIAQADTYEGWSYRQNTFTSSGGTITLDAALTKLLVLNIPFTMTLSCDENGNISYT